MKKSLIYLSLCYLIIGCTSKQGHLRKEEVVIPNIVLVMADDLGWRDVGYNGSQFYETPNIDRLTKEGLKLQNAYANAPNCAPTRASIMSGQYTFRHEVLTVHRSDKGDRKAQPIVPIFGIDTLKGDIQTLPEKLKEARYHTAHFGKWHLGSDPTSGPIAHGFDVNVGGWEKGSPKSYFSPYSNPFLEDGPEGEHITDRLTNEVISYLTDRKEMDQPFFVNYWMYAVHAPIQTKKELEAKYEPKAVTDDQTNPIYAGMVENMDQNVGRIVEALKSNGQLDNTIFIFFSDNGGSWRATVNTPLKGAKGTLYEGGIRIPAFVYAPGIYKGGNSIEFPIISTDFYPTFLKWAGLKPTSGQLLDGMDLSDALEGNQVSERPIYWYSPVYLPARQLANGAYGFRTTPACAVRLGKYKLLRFYGEEHDELYDLSNDIGEKNDLRMKEREIYAKLQQVLDDFHSNNQVPIPSESNPKYDSTYAVKTYKTLRVK